jgi:hypothetical protein
MFLRVVVGGGAVHANAHTVEGLAETSKKIEKSAALPGLQIDLLLSFVDKVVHIFMLNRRAFSSRRRIQSKDLRFLGSSKEKGCPILTKMGPAKRDVRVVGCEVRVGKRQPIPTHVILSVVEGPARAKLVRIGLAKARPTTINSGEPGIN